MNLTKILIYISWLALLAAAIYDLSHQPARIIIWLGGLIILMFIYFRAKKIPLQYNLLLSAIAIMNLFGELVVSFYYKNSIYDKILHFTFQFIAFPIIYILVKDKIKDKKMLILFCICAILSLAVLWEIFEFGIDKNSDLLMQGVYLKPGEGFFSLPERMQLQDKNEDTMYDMIFNLLGSLAIGFIYFLTNNKNKKRTLKN
jgi:uncharacterized membrane protein YjdF